MRLLRRTTCERTGLPRIDMRGPVAQGSERGPLLKMALAAGRAIGPALEYAKIITKGHRQQTGEQEVALRDALNKAGATLAYVGEIE